jgi:quercetin dioxygenase-like cupin family protein
MASRLQYKKPVPEDCMRKSLFILFVLFVSAVPAAVIADDYNSGVKAALILKTTSTTGNYPVTYLDTQSPEITVMKVEIKPGAETGWHSHPVPLYAYVLEGDLAVEVKGGDRYYFTAGDAIVEVINIPHNGKNFSTMPVVLIVFYTGETGTPNTVVSPAGHLEKGE